MNEQEQIKYAVEVYIDRGVDFLIEAARNFVDTKHLDKKITPNQMNALKSIYDKNSNCFTNQKEEIKEFIDKQKEKEEKRKNKPWTEVGDDLKKRIFEFSNSEIDKVKNNIEEYKPNNSIVQELFDGKIHESNLWIKGTLERSLSRAMFNAIYTYYRYRKEMERSKT